MKKKEKEGWFNFLFNKKLTINIDRKKNLQIQIH